MKVKVLEIRDQGTYIPILAVDMNPSADEAKCVRHYLRRCGYPCDEVPNIGITHLSANGIPFSNDPYYWGGRTQPVAHRYIIENWDTLNDGDVVDVEFILGETTTKKQPERYEDL